MSWRPTVSPRSRRVLAGWFTTVLVVMYAPLAVLVLLSFNDSTIAAWSWSGFTTRWYRQALDDPALVSSLLTSAQIALVSSLLALSLASLAAIGLVRARFRGRGLVYLILLSPLIMPFIVVGVVLLVFFKVTAVPLSSATVVLGHALVILPYSLLVLVPRLAQINPEIEEAARDLGAPRYAAQWWVVRPLMVPSLVAGFLIGLSISFDEYAVSSFLIGDGITFPVYLFSRLRQPGGQPEVIATAALMIAVTLTGVCCWELVRALRRRRAVAALTDAPSQEGAA